MTDKIAPEKLTIDGMAIRELAQILVDTDLSEIEYENHGKRVRVARSIQVTATVASAPVVSSAQVSPVSQDENAGSVTTSSDQNAVKSPMVGISYMAPSPGAEPFIKEGDQVSQGQTLLIIEAMKVMNPIKAPVSGTVTRIHVRDKQPVEYGEPLVTIS